MIDGLPPNMVEQYLANLREEVRSGRSLAFQHPEGHLIYTDPSRAFEFLSAGYGQVSYADVVDRHDQIVANLK